jgi:hypothetical protein
MIFDHIVKLKPISKIRDFSKKKLIYPVPDLGQKYVILNHVVSPVFPVYPLFIFSCFCLFFKILIKNGLFEKQFVLVGSLISFWTHQFAVQQSCL